MRTVIILEKSTENFIPLIDKKKSKSVLPVALDKTILSMMYSKVNSYFSRDKIYVVCTQELVNDVKRNCKNINEENIIIEPKKISYSASVFYASMVLKNMGYNDIIFFFPASYLFPDNFKIEKWLFACSESAEKDYIIFPAYLVDKREHENEANVDAGRMVLKNNGTDFFKINSIAEENSKIKKRKIFGKQGKLLYIICGKINSLINIFIEDTNKDLSQLYSCFTSDVVDWQKIKESYNLLKNRSENLNLFKKNDNFLTFFLDTKPNYLDNWYTYYNSLINDSESNIFFGNFSYSNANCVIGFNYDDEAIDLIDIDNLLIIKKDGFVTIKKIEIS